MTVLFSARWRILLGIVIIAAIVVCVTTTHFLTLNNTKAILASTSVVGLAALGLTFITIAGSVVSLATAQTMAVVAMVFLATQSWGLLPAVLIAAFTGVAIGVLQGLAVGYWSINPVVLSIVTAFALTGIATLVSGGTTVNASGTEYSILNSTPAGIPVSVLVFLILAVVSHLALRYSTIGRQIYFVGENRPAARTAGLPLGRIIVFAWGAFGLLSAVGAMFLGAFNTSATINVGGTLTFDAIAAVLTGGTSIAGGRGSARRTVIGVLVISIISNVLLLRGFPTGAQILAKGLLILVFVITVQVRAGRSSR
jgi:simple sugar transport system permease protein/ribose transport system permease protein